MRKVIVIPSRYGSGRFPGKPLAPIAGKSLLERVWKIAAAALSADDVYIATDDERIAEHAKSFSAQVLMTSSDIRTGSDRSWAAIQQLENKPDVILSLQGDAPLIPPWVLKDLLAAFDGKSAFDIATPALALSEEALARFEASKAQGEVGGTSVVFDKDMNALYFSKRIIPFRRTERADRPSYRHLGLYAFHYSALEKFVELESTPLEEIEGLEQLRALENGMRIRIVEVDYRGRSAWAIDAPEDVAVAEEIIARDGELVA